MPSRRSPLPAAVFGQVQGDLLIGLSYLICDAGIRHTNGILPVQPIAAKTLQGQNIVTETDSVDGKSFTPKGSKSGSKAERPKVITAGARNAPSPSPVRGKWRHMREQGKRAGVGQGSTYEDEGREASCGHRMIGEPGMEREEAEWETFFHAAAEGLRGIERD